MTPPEIDEGYQWQIREAAGRLRKSWIDETIEEANRQAIIAATRRARKLAAKKERLKPIAAFADAPTCHYCRSARGETKDHIVPKKRGGGDINNIVRACADCNSRKGHKMPVCDCETCWNAVIVWQQAMLEQWLPSCRQPVIFLPSVSDSVQRSTA